MPPVTFSRTFRVRYYECDSYGHLNNANYPRFMQETAFDASASVGFDQARYAAMNRIWLVRETEIEYFLPFVYNDPIEVRTWVEDFRRVRSRRRYEFLHAETGELHARASTDWVYIDTQTERPASVEAAVIAAYWPGDDLTVAPARDKFPEPPPPPPGKFSITKRVEWRDIDTRGHMNNAVYFNYIEDCSTQVAVAFKWPMSRIAEAGFGIITRRHRMEYLQPALMDEELEITTWVSNVKRATAHRHYTIRRVDDGALLARCLTLWVWVDLSTGRPMRVPPDFVEDFRPNIVDS